MVEKRGEGICSFNVILKGNSDIIRDSSLNVCHFDVIVNNIRVEVPIPVVSSRLCTELVELFKSLLSEVIMVEFQTDKGVVSFK